ncbi:kinesin [Monocercomonoides exilis]|uniref:kinesin n=1 Tax=Monocercomonoides exilis TaxID=2049356 RepID=UPI003559F3FB|nr:kinesin [Monocercomonoides exilis]|eukprot:MONOS_4319.1-p1 / transcript=MONOS_4319.1 / gene=MONOS_4319 / organism=Monocercomonoides_exilis_PA203 / gene_product=kinesin 5 / transcript_product=kinesin 5 / location=Mono_scaffold00113:87784-90284(+) / protein_length=785 / sequence_SO=supercontig / SO=protein_coding / is_pseudo=false
MAFLPDHSVYFQSKSTEIQTTEDPIKVVIRARPLQDEEQQFVYLQRTDTGKQTIHVPTTIQHSQGTSSTSYTFDRIYDTTTNQQTIFNEIAKPTVDDCLKGYNCTIFAYGLTGSGKTYTMEGKHNEKGDFDGLEIGIIPRSLHRIFSILESACPGGVIGEAGEASSSYASSSSRGVSRPPSRAPSPSSSLSQIRLDDLFTAVNALPPANADLQQLFGDSHITSYKVMVSNVEVYMESLNDLLVEEKKGADSVSRGQEKRKLTIVQSKENEVVVQGLREEIVTSTEDALYWLKEGSKKRATAGTLLNPRSSRSHSIFTISVQIWMRTKQGVEEIKLGKLNLVDLAGSECVGKSKAEKLQQQEAGFINQSLLSLSKVITALQQKQSYIPYRETNLTRILQNSLGGNSKTTLIATVDLSKSNAETTKSTLDFAFRTKSIQNKPKLNVAISSASIIKGLEVELQKTRRDLQQQIEKEGVCVPVDEVDRLRKAEKDMKKLEEMLEERDEELKSEREQVEELRAQLDKVNAEKEEVAEAKREIEGVLCESEKNAEELKDKLDKANDEISSLKAEKEELITQKSELHERYLKLVAESQEKEQKLNLEEEKKREIGEKYKVAVDEWEDYSSKRRQKGSSFEDFQTVSSFLMWMKGNLIPKLISPISLLAEEHSSSDISKESEEIKRKEDKLKEEVDEEFEKIMKDIQKMKREVEEATAKQKEAEMIINQMRIGDSQMDAEILSQQQSLIERVNALQKQINDRHNDRIESHTRILDALHHNTSVLQSSLSESAI